MFPFPDKLTEKWLCLNLKALSKQEKAGWEFQNSDKNYLFLTKEGENESKQGKTLGSILPLFSLNPETSTMQAIIFFSNSKDADNFAKIINFLFNETVNLFAQSFTPTNANIDFNQLPHILCTTPAILRGYFPELKLSQFKFRFCIIDKADVQLKESVVRNILFEYLDEIKKHSPSVKWIFNALAPEKQLVAYEKYFKN